MWGAFFVYFCHFLTCSYLFLCIYLHICINLCIFHNMGNEKKMYTRKELAAELGVHVNTVYNWLNNGLPFYQACPRGRCLIRMEDYERWAKK